MSKKKNNFKTTNIKKKKGENSFYIYIHNSCDAGCVYAKQLLKKYPYEEIMVTNENINDIYNELDKITKKYRSFPMIFIDNVFVGSERDLEKLLK